MNDILLLMWLQEVRNAAAVVHASGELLRRTGLPDSKVDAVRASHQRGLARLQEALVDERFEGVDIAHLQLLRFDPTARPCDPAAWRTESLVG